MKIAYLILAHCLPEQLERLVSRLSSQSTHIFIHIDARADSVYELCRERLSGADRVKLVEKRIKCRWGQYSLVEATLSCIKEMLGSDVDFDYCCLLSGQDYPIKSTEFIENYLYEEKGSEFIEFFRLDKPNIWTDHGGAFNSMRRIQHFHIPFRSRNVHIPIKRRLPNDINPYGGSQWWLLTKSCINWIMNYLADNPGFARYFRTAFIPDELFFQCLVLNSPFASNVVNNNLHFVDFSRGHPTPPATMQSEDLSLLKGIDHLFARKFNMEKNREIMDRLDGWLDGSN